MASSSRLFQILEKSVVFCVYSHFELLERSHLKIVGDSMILTFHVPPPVIAYVKIWQSVKFPALDEVDHLNTLEEFGGAVLPSQVDLDRLMAKKSRFGEGAPKVRLVVGSHYGRNSDGSSKPIRSFLEE